MLLATVAGQAPYTLTMSTPPALPAGYSSEVWAQYPTKVPVNTGAEHGESDANGAELAPLATNIATAMELAGYSPYKARAAAANYLTYHYNARDDA